jgi:hypothetical protein
MSLLSQLAGTFLMFLGFIGVLAGTFLYRMKQEDLGKMYMSTTMMGGGEMSDAPLVRFLTQLRGNDSLKKQRALQVLIGGALLAVVGAWLA